MAKGGKMRPGVKSTEFWLTIATVVATALSGISGICDPKTATILGTISTTVYTIARAFTKASTGVDPSPLGK